MSCAFGWVWLWLPQRNTHPTRKMEEQKQLKTKENKTTPPPRKNSQSMGAPAPELGDEVGQVQVVQSVRLTAASAQWRWGGVLVWTTVLFKGPSPEQASGSM